MRGIIIFTLLVCVIFTQVFGQSVHCNKRDGHHEIHTNNLELFSGVTVFKDAGLYTIGLDYEHRFSKVNQRLGAGVLVDYEFGHDHHSSETLITPTIFYFPSSHFKLFAGYGFSYLLLDHESDNIQPHNKHVYGLFRFGIGAEMDLSHHLVLSPTVSIDHTSFYTALVSGIAFGLAY